MSCVNCKYFESRTKFCRRFPPVVVLVKGADGVDHVTSKFPKIGMPEVDYCHEMVEKTSVPL